MAEGGKNQTSFEDRFSKASGDADESFCDPLEKKQMPAGEGSEGSATNQDLCTEACQTHHTKIIMFYCKAHDEPGCEDCMTIKHSSTPCTKDRVQDISNGFKQTEELKEIDQKLHEFHQEVVIMVDVLDDNLENLKATYNSVLQKIELVREQINEFLDQMQKEITEEAAQMKKKDETELEALIAENKSMKSELEDVIQRKKNASDVNENSVFVITKQAKQRLLTMRSDFNKIKHSWEHEYEFLITDEFERILSAKTPLGKLTKGSQQKIWNRKRKLHASVLPDKRAKHESNIQE